MESSDGTAWDDEVRAFMQATVGPVTSGSSTPDLEVFRDPRRRPRGGTPRQELAAYRKARFDAGYGALTLASSTGRRPARLFASR